MSLAQIREAPDRNVILLVGQPGAGKSALCHQVVLNGLAMDKPVVFVTTEHGPTEVIGLLREKGMGELPPNALSFIDAFGETVGVTTPQRPDTIGANCEDLNSISMAITKLQQRIGKRDILLSFDSLTAPYLFNEKEVFRFMRLCLMRFASEGNSVLALMDEGCGKEEDLTAMMSTADGIVKIETKEDKRLFNVVKHPRVTPTRIEASLEPGPIGYEEFVFNPDVLARYIRGLREMRDEAVLRREVGDFVNSFWPNFAHWSCMLWDPKRFPTMTYNANKYAKYIAREFIHRLPWHTRLFFKLFMPKNFSKVKDMKKLFSWFRPLFEGDRGYITEYNEKASKTDEHYMRVHECAMCWGFENVGATLHLGVNGAYAGALAGIEKEDRDWNMVATKCIGIGDAYCEVKLVPGEIDELKGSLESIDSTIVERIRNRHIDRLMGFILHGKPLWKERPRLGDEIGLHTFSYAIQMPAFASERYRVAMRLGGAVTGKEVGELLMDAGLIEDEAVNSVINLLQHCKVGNVTVDETIRIMENCESFLMRGEKPSCYFTTGFLNGLFSSVKNLHVKETKCIAMGDPYCEWEFR